MRAISFRLFGILAVIHSFTTAADAAIPNNGLHARFLGELRPSDLPSGVAFGGGGNSFERRVDVSGSLAVVGAGIFGRGADAGRAFLFDFSDPSNIRQLAVLRASDNSAGNEFGNGVAISGNYVFVSAHGDSDRGAVYMYDVSDPLHVVERKITAFDAEPGDGFGFGFSLAVDKDRLIVGSPFSAAYIIDFSDPDHLTQTKIDPNFPGLGNGYGLSVDISGDYAIVGRSSDSTEFPFAGSAYLYDISDLNSIKSKRLTATDAPNYFDFGNRVSISGTKALVSVSSDPGPTNSVGTSDGAVWAFDFSDWNNIVQHEYGRPVTPRNPPTPFGRFLDLEGDIAYAGAFNEDRPTARGAIYLHDVSNVRAPAELLRIPSPSDDTLRFGVSFAVDGRILVASDSAGSVFLFQIVPESSSLLLAATILGFFAVIRHRSPLR
jgi:hypothetical protein